MRDFAVRFQTWIIVALSCVLFVRGSPEVLACTSVVLGSGPNIMLGQNYDFPLAHGALFANASGKRKTSLTGPGEKAVDWTAKYASVVFSQFGRELPISGMNEAGLIVQGLWNNDTATPDSAGEPALNELQWIQYQLDNFSSLEEVLSHLGQPKIKKAYADLHYVICDAMGRCGLAEFRSGALVSYAGDSYRLGVITNSARDRSLAFYEPLSKEPLSALKKEKESLHVFARAAWLAQDFERRAKGTAPTVPDVLTILNEAEQRRGFADLLTWILEGKPPSITVWSAVFVPAKRQIFFRTHGSNVLREIDTGKLAARCPSPDQALGIEQAPSAPMRVNGNFSPSSVESENRRIIAAAYAPVEKQFPKSQQNDLQTYPSSFPCQIP